MLSDSFVVMHQFVTGPGVSLNILGMSVLVIKTSKNRIIIRVPPQSEIGMKFKVIKV